MLIIAFIASHSRLYSIFLSFAAGIKQYYLVNWMNKCSVRLKTWTRRTCNHTWFFARSKCVECKLKIMFFVEIFHDAKFSYLEFTSRAIHFFHGAQTSTTFRGSSTGDFFCWQWAASDCCWRTLSNTGSGSIRCSGWLCWQAEMKAMLRIHRSFSECVRYFWMFFRWR